MSDVEFFGQIKPQPFKSLSQIEAERIEAIKQTRLKATSKPLPAPEPEWTREPFTE